MYTKARTDALEHFGVHIEGSSQALFLAIVDDTCTPALRDAIEKAVAARGYACGATWLQPWVGDTVLTDEQMLEAIEALDPMCVIVLGTQAVELFAAVYRLDSSTAERTVAMGRPVCLVSKAEKLMATNAGRQHLWSLIKSLPEKHDAHAR